VLGLLLFFHRDWWLQRPCTACSRRRLGAALAAGSSSDPPTTTAGADLHERRDVDAAMLRRVRPEPPARLLELPLAPDAVPAPGLVPRDRDVDEPLEEVALARGGRAPASSSSSCAAKYSPRAHQSSRVELVMPLDD
jgi:hypothetical protein